MKVLAVIDVAQGVAPERLRPELVNEFKASRALFIAGALREA